MRFLLLSSLVIVAAACSSATSSPDSPLQEPPGVDAASAEAAADGSEPLGDGGSAGRDARSGGADARSPGDAASGGDGTTGSGLTPGTSTLTLTVAGLTRTVTLHVPTAHPPMPLVLALHGDGDTATNFIATSGLTADSDADGFVLAAPQGITRSVAVHENGSVVQTIPSVDWDPYNSIQSSGAVVSADNDDVPLLDAIRERLTATGAIDANHVVVYGYSQGGYMSLRYGMSASSSVACAAVLAAASPLPGTQLIEGAARKTPVFLQIGTLDSAYSAAQSTLKELQNSGNPTQWVAVQGAGHVPIPGDPKAPLNWCLAKTL